MGMRVSGAGSNASMAAWQTRRQDIGSLVSAVKSGDLSGAQQAFATLSGLSSSSSGSTASGQSQTGSSSNSTTSQSGSQTGPLAAVGQALANGDLAAAQMALASAFGGAGGGHHHHHSHGASSATATPAAAPQLPVGTTISTLA